MSSEEARGASLRPSDTGLSHGRIAHAEWPADPALDPEFVFGLAALHGFGKSLDRKFDILELGCGSGARLERAGRRSKGLIIGVEPSPAAREDANARLARFGGRVQIVGKGLDAIDAHSLGAFDLVLLLGALDPLTSPLRLLILETAARCLARGGVAVVGYDAGAGLDVALIEAVVAPLGLEFLDTAPPGPSGGGATSAGRALAAAAEQKGRRAGPCVMLFGKGGQSGPANPRSPKVRWATRLVHPPVGLAYRGPATYHDAAAGLSALIERPEGQAAIDELAGAPKTFAQIVGGARARLAKAGVRPDAAIADIVGDELLRLSWRGLAAPLWREA